jgi:hypothetical protein
MRVVFGFVLALCVGVGACFASAQAANSAKANGRIVTLKIGDVAVLGNAQCRVISYSPRHPYEYVHVQCSNGPLSKAAYSFATNGFASDHSVGIDVFQKGVSAAIYSTNPPGGNQRAVSGKTRIVRLRVGDVAVVLNGPGAHLVRVQCRAFSHSNLRCSTGPLRKAPYSAGITNAGINVYKKGSSAPIYSTPPAATSG